METHELDAELERLREEVVPGLRAEQHRAEVQPAIDRVVDRWLRLFGEYARHWDAYEKADDHARAMHELQQATEALGKATEALRELFAFESEDLRENARVVAYCKRLDEAEIAGPRIKKLLTEERQHGS